MKFGSLEHFGVDPRKIVILAFAVSAAAVIFFRVAVGDVLGSATLEVQAVVSALAFYAVVSTPRRLFQASAMSQSRDALMLSAMASAGMEVVGSRSRTLFLLNPRDPEIRSALREARRMILLGVGVREAVVRVSQRFSSYSAANVLRGVGSMRPGAISERGEENEGFANAGRLAEETKLPIFMTVCLFSPIMLLLYSVFSHLSSVSAFVELLALEVVALDFAFYFCSREKRRP